jgi:hypothetical protein
MVEKQLEEALVITDRASKIDQLITDLMNGTKKLSFSSLKAFRNSPSDFIDYCFREKEQTDAMKLGLIIHCLVLEPEQFEKRYTIMDDTEICVQIGGAKPRATTKYKEWKEVFELTAIGEIIPFKVWQQANIIAGNIQHNRAAGKVLSICPNREQHIEWNYKNFAFHGYYDGGGEKARLDIKLVPDASPRKAQRTIIDMWYHGQAGMYLTAEGKRLPYYIICADRKGGVSVHKIDKSLLDHALEEYSDLVDKFNECLLKENFNQSYDFWAESYDGIFVVDKPAYMY